jgi:hypothetical protein
MDPRTGVINALNNGGSHDSDRPAATDQCHDITVYSEIGLAAGACSGNGILLDVRDPANPRRVDAVNDPNYSYWHSASFSNDGTRVVFTDEWGGGIGARCRLTDPNVWGANAIFRLRENRLSFASYYKMPAAQTATENCVAHNGSLIPIPGRDIKVQSWYQGGISIMDFTDPERPVEIAYFDRGPIDEKTLVLGGAWSTYWYNGYIYSSEIARGLDILELLPGEFLSQSEIDAARAVESPSSMFRIRSESSGRRSWWWRGPTSISSSGPGRCRLRSWVICARRSGPQRVQASKRSESPAHPWWEPAGACRLARRPRSMESECWLSPIFWCVRPDRISPSVVKAGQAHAALSSLFHPLAITLRLVISLFEFTHSQACSVPME